MRLGERGVEIESEVHWERGGTSVYFRDPDNNLLELANAETDPNNFTQITARSNLDSLDASSRTPFYYLIADRFDVKWVIAVGFFVWSTATAVTGVVHGMGLTWIALVNDVY